MTKGKRYYIKPECEKYWFDSAYTEVEINIRRRAGYTMAELYEYAAELNIDILDVLDMVGEEKWFKN